MTSPQGLVTGAIEEQVTTLGAAVDALLARVGDRGYLALMAPTGQSHLTDRAAGLRRLREVHAQEVPA